MQGIEQKWQNPQYKFFEEEWDKKWKEKFPERGDLKDKILKLEYNNFHDVNYAFGKLDKALQISNFLYDLTKSKPSQNTEKIIIMTLVSIAEAVYRINEPDEPISENLIKGFFGPVKSKIDCKIKGYVGDMPYKKTFEAIEVLYLIRNDYIHNGNFIGKFFSSESESGEQKESFCFSEKDNKTLLIQVFSECSLTYEEFLKIFLEAFIENINKYCNAKYVD